MNKSRFSIFKTNRDDSKKRQQQIDSPPERPFAVVVFPASSNPSIANVNFLQNKKNRLTNTKSLIPVISIINILSSINMIKTIQKNK